MVKCELRHHQHPAMIADTWLAWEYSWLCYTCLTRVIALILRRGVREKLVLQSNFAESNELFTSRNFKSAAVAADWDHNERAVILAKNHGWSGKTGCSKTTTSLRTLGLTGVFKMICFAMIDNRWQALVMIDGSGISSRRVQSNDWLHTLVH